MKSVKSIHSKFESINSLGIRQGGGSMPKRQAQGVDYAARRLMLRDTFKLGGVVAQFSRRGYENVFDVGFEKMRLYCAFCGTMSKNESETICRVCKSNFETVGLFDEKFGDQSSLFGHCQTCELPFYVKDKLKTGQVLKFQKVIGASNIVRYNVRPDASGIKQFDKQGIEVDAESGILADRADLAEYQTCICDNIKALKQDYASKLRFDRQIKNVKKQADRKVKILKGIEAELCKINFQIENAENAKVRKLFMKTRLSIYTRMNS